MTTTLHHSARVRPGCFSRDATNDDDEEPLAAAGFVRLRRTGVNTRLMGKMPMPRAGGHEARPALRWRAAKQRLAQRSRASAMRAMLICRAGSRMFWMSRFRGHAEGPMCWVIRNTMRVAAA